MKKINAFLLILFLFSTFLFSQERGIKVVAKTTDGKILELYKECHALVIGVSDYLYGWPDLPNAANDAYEVGDDVNVTIAPIGLNDTFRIKQKKVNVDGKSGETVTLILGESAKYRSHKDYVDRLAWIKKKIIETEFRIPS